MGESVYYQTISMKTASLARRNIRQLGRAAMGLTLLCTLLILTSCKEDSPVSKPVIAAPISDTLGNVSALDLSFYPEIAFAGTRFRDSNAAAIDLLDFIKSQGVNTVRLRLWHSPAKRGSSLAQVDSLARILKQKGLKVWLCLHYSDTWADPGHQETPAAWQGLDYSTLKDSLRAYTAKVMQRISPNIVQIGNEINPGFLHPFGRISDNTPQFKELLALAIEEVRSHDSTCKVMLHYAGVNNATWFFNQMTGIDFDIMGLSYYPLWHGKDLLEIENSLNSLAQDFPQELLIAETAYPFTLAWNDWTNNIVGWDEHLILPDYPASAQGQKDFLMHLRQLVLRQGKLIGFAYWGAEMVAFRGDTASNGSSWENQALFDFDNNALPAWEAFRF